MAFSQFVILLSCLIPSSSIIMATIVNFIFDINRLCHLGSQSLFVSALGTKRLASEELANDWDNKRLNPGNDNYPLSTAGTNNLFLGIEQGAGSSNGQAAFSKFDNGSSMALPSGQAMSGLMGKGAKWRDGDWMCSNCNNHNYASRAFCNRCKTQKESAVHPGVL